MEDEIKRWTAKRKSALVMEILQGKTTVPEASRSHLGPTQTDKVVSINDRYRPFAEVRFVQQRTLNALVVT